MRKLVIIGSGDLGQQIAYHATATGKYAVAGFIDDFRQRSEIVQGIPVLGGVDAIDRLFREMVFDCLVVAIGYKHFTRRKEVFDMFAPTIPMATIIHPAAVVDPSSKIGAGSVILSGCLVDQQVTIGENVFINVGSCIAHDSKVGAHTFLSPRVAIAGFVTVGKSCNIGIQTTVIDNIRIADHVQTGGGTVVIKDLTAGGLYVGNPARFIR
jgi:sugar O-acyltransferase (sialic acid O-acetyltransferase NeuD family)